MATKKKKPEQVEEAPPIESTEQTQEVAVPDLPTAAEETTPSGTDETLSNLELAAELEAEAADSEEPGEEPIAEEKQEERPKKRRAKKADAGADEEADSAKKSRAELQEDRRKREVARAEKTERNQAFYSGISSLQAAEKTNMILSGQIVSVERKERPVGTVDAPRYMIAASVLLEGRYKVLIPFSELFRDNPIDMSSVDVQSREGREDFERRQRQLVEKMYGVCIDFCVTNVVVENPNDYAISGSRRKALLAQEKRNFGGKAPRFKVGGTYPATILSVGNFALRVTLGGVDASIALRDTTFEYLPNLHAKYKAGDEIVVKIRAAGADKNTGALVLDLSAKEPELERVREAQKSGIINEGLRTIGQITTVRASTSSPGKIIIHAYLPYFKMPAVIQAMSPMDLGATPKAGDFVRVEVKGITETGFVRTVCRGFQDAPSIFMAGRN